MKTKLPTINPIDTLFRAMNTGLIVADPHRRAEAMRIFESARVAIEGVLAERDGNLQAWVKVSDRCDAQRRHIAQLQSELIEIGELVDELRGQLEVAESARDAAIGRAKATP